MKEISEKLEKRIKNNMKNRPSGKAYFPSHIVKAYRAEIKDFKTDRTLILAQMIDIATEGRGF